MAGDDEEEWQHEPGSPGDLVPWEQGAPHPNAPLHLQRAEGKARLEITKKETRDLQRLGEAMILHMEGIMQHIAKLKMNAMQQARAAEASRKQVVNEQVRVRARIEDDWLRGLEKLLYGDFIEGAKRLRIKMKPTPPAGSAHNAALTIALGRSLAQKKPHHAGIYTGEV
eukprot:TRINITY_DN28117_c0_g1_i1.p1 TRINITY_DN28117_c0_g1~~TRINITY_DN28117_c0_g1_i1.p1  ORF type:complete len:187 (+),score=60.97 TRINITY_DN28117_c0_g1_i1:56-562(+)